jgi:hypothetical protein
MVPGHMLRYECPCGLSGSASPGYCFARGGQAAVYDGVNVETADSEEAQRKGLATLPDPFLQGDLPIMEHLARRSRGVVEKLEYPACGKRRMKCFYSGNWD